MQDGEALSNRQPQVEQAPIAPAESTSSTVAVEVAAVDDDAMDTTPDTDVQFVPPDGSASQISTSAEQPTSPTMNGAGIEEADISVQSEPVNAADDAVSAETCLPSLND